MHQYIDSLLISVDADMVDFYRFKVADNNLCLPYFRLFDINMSMWCF